MGVAPQLDRVTVELAEARRRAHAMTAPLTDEQWRTCPARNEWSVAECLIHLNLTSRAFLPRIREAIHRGRELGLGSTGRYRRDLVGWFVYWITEPSLRFRINVRTKTTAPFVPAGVEPRDRVLAAFDTLQEQLVACVSEADGLDLGRLRIVSPFDSRLKYNLYSCLTIIAAHQRQHLAQVERVLESLRVFSS